MGFRFRKRFKLAPGLYLNAGSRGLGLSLGGRGGSISFGPSGTYLNSSIPGTGISFRDRVGGGGRLGPSQRQLRAAARAVAVEQMSADLDYLIKYPPVASFDDNEGPVILKNSDGSLLDGRLADLMWRRCRDDITRAISQVLDEKKRRVELLGRLHLTLPPPDPQPKYRAKPFDVERPAEPILKTYHWFWTLFASHRRRIDDENKAAANAHAANVVAWEQDKAKHEAAERDVGDIYALRSSTSVADIERFLEWHLGKADWPQETIVSLSLPSTGDALFLDVDLPEIESFPTGWQELSAKGDTVRFKKLSDSNRRQLYMHYVHGVALKLCGEVFAHIPSLSEIVVSGYSQRPNPQTAAIEDQYLYSVRIPRPRWCELNFTRLDALDPGEALGRFEIRRQVTKTGLFKPIEPFAADVS